MKNILKNIFLGGAIAVASVSCDMNLEPTTAIVFDEDKPIFESVTDIDGFRNGVLASYRGVQYGTYTQSTEVMCDGFNALTGFGNNYGSIHRTDASFTTSDSYAETMWAGHYSAIKNYNIAIEQADYILLADEGTYDEEMLVYAQFLKGTAQFCRASSYLTLARHFGPDYNEDTASDDLCVPLVLFYDQYEKPARATVQEVYDAIYLDLDEAMDNLYGLAYEGMPRSADVTMDAVRALLARYYLDTEDYANAAKMADAIISSETYTLSSSSAEMSAEFSKDSGNEAIIQLFASMNEGLVGNTIFTQVERDRKGKYFRPYYIPSQKLIDAYENTDLRLINWYTNTMYPIFTNGERHKNIYVFIKYLGNPNFQLGALESGAVSAKPLMISEMYLISAEANLLNDNPTKAKRSLNALQSARKATATSATLENIKMEWFKETVGEGLRLSCLKRWGDGFNGRPAQSRAQEIVMTGEYYDERVMEPGDYVMNWPVPSYELKLNDNLEQNDGYDVE